MEGLVLYCVELMVGICKRYPVTGGRIPNKRIGKIASYGSNRDRLWYGMVYPPPSRSFAIAHQSSVTSARAWLLLELLILVLQLMP
jgi:hypothetical protein